MIQGVVNLILSVWLAIAWSGNPQIFGITVSGVAGVYVGTVISGLIANITKPVIIYRTCFDKSAVGYFIDSFKYLASMALVMVICYLIGKRVMPEPTILGFAAMVVTS